MTPTELNEDITIELEAMELIVNELTALEHDVEPGYPTVREITAAEAFLAQFYNGVENILKRISIYHGVPSPTGPAWHIELFQRFTTSAVIGPPPLINEELAIALAPYRRFRHVVFHSYGFQQEWSRIQEGVANAGVIFMQFRAAVVMYLEQFNER